MFKKLLETFERKYGRSNTVISLIGNTDELLQVNNDKTMKMTRLFDLGEGLDEEQEILDISITSTNPYGAHEKFDRLIGKKIKLTVEILDDEG